MSANTNATPAAAASNAAAAPAALAVPVAPAARAPRAAPRAAPVATVWSDAPASASASAPAPYTTLTFVKLIKMTQKDLASLLKTIPESDCFYAQSVKDAITAVISKNTAVKECVAAAAAPATASDARSGTPCRKGEACTKKDTCAFKHPVSPSAAPPVPCRYGNRCTKKDTCAYKHTESPSAAASAAAPAPKDKSWMATVDCKNGDSCDNRKCGFKHSIAWKHYGSSA